MPKEIAEKLSATCFNVKANEVSIATYRMKAKRRGKKPRRLRLRLPLPRPSLPPLATT